MTAPWLAPDGREWGARRLLKLPRTSSSSPHKFCLPARMFVPPTRTPIARAIAVNKIWPLMGYELKCRLAKGDA